jgi:hypothetical protein
MQNRRIKIEWACQIMVSNGKDTLLENVETLVVAGKEFNKLCMGSRNKHEGYHEER